MNFVIYEANSLSLESLSRLRNKLWPKSIKEHENVLLKDFDSDKKVFFIAKKETDEVAFLEVNVRDYANGCTNRPVLFIEGIYVEPEFRRANISKLLINELEIWARENGFLEICSDCNVENKVSICAHDSWGFQETEKVLYFRKDLN